MRGRDGIIVRRAATSDTRAVGVDHVTAGGEPIGPARRVTWPTHPLRVPRTKYTNEKKKVPLLLVLQYYCSI